MIHCTWFHIPCYDLLYPDNETAHVAAAFLCGSNWTIFSLSIKGILIDVTFRDLELKIFYSMNIVFSKKSTIILKMSIWNPLFLLNDSDPASCVSLSISPLCAEKGPTGVWMLVFRVKSVKSAPARAKQIESLWQYCEGVTTDKWNRNSFVRVFFTTV